MRSRHFIFVLLVWFFTVFAFISLSKHQHFQTFAWDLSFFDELIWKVSRGIEPRSSFNNLHILGDHFQPVLYAFVPLYWIKSDVRLLLIAHAFIATAGAYPIYIIAKNRLRSTFLALAVCGSFLLFTGYQHGVLDGFHQSVFVPLFIGLVFLSLERNSAFWYWLSILAILMVKEEYALLVAAIGMPVLLVYKQPKRGILTVLMGFVSFFLMVYVLIPFFQKGPYTHFGYGMLGATPSEVVLNTLKSPANTLRLLFFSPVKLKTIADTFFSFGFLPLLSPALLLPVAQQFFVRFADTVSIHRWTNLNHYSFPLSPLMTVATIYSLEKLIKKGFAAWMLGVYVLGFALLQNVVNHGPVNSLFKPNFYTTHQWERDAHLLVEQVPQNVPVASQNSLLPHLSQRNKFFLLPEIGVAEYIAVDLADGPNKYSPLDHARTTTLIYQILADKKYSQVWKSGESILLKKIPN